MKVGDLVKRIDPMIPTHRNGVIVGFDSDGDPIILWNNGMIEEEFANQVKVVDGSR
jgi:UDP-N-acetylmuramyl tripeptide synthase